MDVKKNARLRELISQPGIVVAPGCHDGLTARLVQQNGFQVCYMGGNGTMASYLGIPDIGLGTATEMITRARYLAEVLDIPLVCDADTGYGDVSSVVRTVREYEAAGVSGIHFEDQVMPKKCGSMGGVQVVPVEEICAKIKAALEARRDPNFMIIARTDCFNTLGIDEAIDRCKKFWDVGADMLMPENFTKRKDVERVARELVNYKSPYRDDKPIVLYDVCEFEEGRIFSDQELEEMGYKFVIHPLASILHEAYTMNEFYKEYKATGNTKSMYQRGIFEKQQVYQDILGYSDAMALREKYKT
ncbi:MAG: isocitrate lyase/PEP mutase family protein [Oscillospiraceae bacterium]|jgi:2-methylisocitrate lyase-like PEP mutase family enzyme|nr:isocitrate lyase/PEP mutase family protein [Candidatus Limivicinus sp.]